VEQRTEKLIDLANSCPYNTVEDNGADIGIITSGITYQYAKEALEDQVNYCKLGLVWPLPTTLLSDFCKKCKTVYVIEELDPFIEEHCRAMGLTVIGKEKFSLLGEYTPNRIRSVVLGKEPPASIVPKEALPSRPPVLCPGCPHRGTFYVLQKLGLTVSGDIGCYTLGAVAPLSTLDTCICMGAAVSAAHGMSKVKSPEFNQTLVSVIGDSTFLHSGITGLMDMVYNQSANTVIILDNSITGMTGHQQNPATGKTIRGKATRQIDLIDLCRATGVEHVTIADPFDVKNFEKVVKEEVNRDEPSVIIAQRPCALLKTVKYSGRCVVDADKCRNCKMCMKLGCPAITADEKGVHIDPNQCNGCGLCVNVCPFGAIEKQD
jgi:indolepyruvate ferredoxin oxidoreductase alpha subunit